MIMYLSFSESEEDEQIITGSNQALVIGRC